MMFASGLSKGNSVALFPIDYYIVKYQTILDGEIVKIEDHRFKIKVHDLIKGKSNLDGTINVKIGYQSGLRTSKLDSLGIEVGTNYIFILGTRPKWLNPKILRESYNRFVIKNDSLFIPQETLRGIDFPDSIDINAPNIYNDSFNKFGYKISTLDFRKLIVVLNETFGMNKLAIWKKQPIDNSVDSFTLALLNHLDKWWNESGKKWTEEPVFKK